MTHPAGAAGTAPPPGKPLQVFTTSLKQDGLDFVWRLQLAKPVAPAALAKDHRTLRLLIERPGNDTVAGQVCVVGKGRQGGPRVIYEPISAAGPGPARPVTATITGSPLPVAAPPYGYIDRGWVSVARSLGMLTVMCDVDPSDYTFPGATVIYRRIIAAAHNSAIVIQHFGGGPRYQKLAALPHGIAALRAAGYRFVTVAQLLGLTLIYR